VGITVGAVLGAWVSACAPPPAPARATEPPSAIAASPNCANEPLERQCGAFREEGFVESYVQFFYATPHELHVAFPFGVPPSQSVESAREPEPPEEAQLRAEVTRAGLSWLRCFSITEQELDALADVFGIKRPERRPDHGLPKAVADRPVPHLDSALFFPGGCAMIFEVPRALVENLARETDVTVLGRKWTAALLGAGPNPASTDFDPFQPGARDPRDDVRAWTVIAGDLVEFARLSACGNRKLYVEIAFDC
jgi:hypothetical protein